MAQFEDYRRDADRRVHSPQRAEVMATTAMPMPRRSSASPPAVGTALVRIDLWTWPLEASRRETAALEAVLSANERCRASSFVLAEDRHRFIVGRARLRQVLARYVAMPPEALRFYYGAHGKPALSPSRFAPCFNLSHSAGLAALAIARCDVGVDIEEVRPVDGAVAERFFSPGENAALRGLRGAAWRDAFYRCWTRKEAVVKALGKGLSLRLASFEVSVARSAPLLLRLEGCRDAASQWSIVDIALPRGLVGAIAARTMGRGVSVERHRWSRNACAAGGGRWMATS
jgi:4'-phosphopantetheinyl transferase